jgi:hypothetical protein
MGMACPYHTGKKRNAYSVLVEEPEGEIPLERFRHKQEDNTNTDLKEMAWVIMVEFIWFWRKKSGRL